MNCAPRVISIITSVNTTLRVRWFVSEQHCSKVLDEIFTKFSTVELWDKKKQLIRILNQDFLAYSSFICKIKYSVVHYYSLGVVL